MYVSYGSAFTPKVFALCIVVNVRLWTLAAHLNAVR